MARLERLRNDKMLERKALEAENLNKSLGYPTNEPWFNICYIVMAFFTKVDYGRQLQQYSANTVLFSGSTDMEQYLTVGSAVTVGQSISGAGEFYSYIDINSWVAVC